MKKEFSTGWVGSKQPRKQRKYLAKAPLHLKRKLTSANLSKELRKKHKVRSMPLRKDDVVKVMNGKFKGKTGKVISIKTKTLMAQVEGLQIKKMDGSKVNAKFRPSNLQIQELSTSDSRRHESLGSSSKEKPKETVNKVNKEKTTGEKNAPQKTTSA